MSGVSWNEAEVDRLRALVAGGLSLKQAAQAMGRSYYAVQIKSSRIGLDVRRVRAPEPAPAPKASRVNGDAFPPGHEASWGAITAGTMLEGLPYPAPGRSAVSSAPPLSASNQPASLTPSTSGSMEQVGCETIAGITTETFGVPRC